MQVTKDITDLSAAAFLKDIGKQCPVTARLSTVVHERGCVHPTSHRPTHCLLPACVAHAENIYISLWSACFLQDR